MALTVRGLVVIFVGTFSLFTGCEFLVPSRHVSQAVRRDLSMEKLEIASTALAAVHGKIGQYPSSGVAFSSLPAAVCDSNPEFCRRGRDLDGWGHQPLYWSNGQHFVVLSAGRDGLLDAKYVDWLATLDLSDRNTFCPRVLDARRDDMLLVDGQNCVGGLESGEPEHKAE